MRQLMCLCLTGSLELLWGIHALCFHVVAGGTDFVVCVVEACGFLLAAMMEFGFGCGPDNGSMYRQNNTYGQ